MTEPPLRRALTVVEEPDVATWELFVASHPYGSLLQSAAWGTFKARWGWQPRRLLVCDGERPVAGVQVLFRPLPLGKALAYVPRGPVAAPDQHEALACLWAALHQLARHKGTAFLTVEPNWPMSPEEGVRVLGPVGFRPGARHVQPRATLVVDLRPPLDEILARMKQKWRYNIRLSARKGVEVRVGGEADFHLFYALMVETGQRDQFAVRPLNYYRDAWQAFQPDRSALLIAEYQGIPLAGLLVFRCGPVAYYLYGASSNRERQRMPNHALQWAAMQWAKGHGCERYDLWGIPAEAVQGGSVNPQRTGGLWGVYRFKRGFGGHPVRYPGVFDAVYNPLVYVAYRVLSRPKRGR